MNEQAKKTMNEWTNERINNQTNRVDDCRNVTQLLSRDTFAWHSNCLTVAFSHDTATVVLSGDTAAVVLSRDTAAVVLSRDTADAALSPKSNQGVPAAVLPTFYFPPQCPTSGFSSTVGSPCMIMWREAAADYPEFIDNRCCQDVGTGVCRRSAWLLQQSTCTVSAENSCDICRVSRTRLHGSSLVLGNTITSRQCCATFIGCQCDKG